MKRGAIELPAVMIFIMVAGALIIVFFSVLASRQGESANKGIQATSLQRLDTLLKGAGTARETANNITIIDETLNFECEPGTDKTRLYYDSGIDTFIFNQVVFSPRELGGGQLRTYTKGASEGYRVTTILYLSSAQNIIQNATDMYGFPPNFQYKSLADTDTPDPRWRVVVRADQATQERFRQARDMVAIDEQPGGYGSVQYIRRNAQLAITYDKTIYYDSHELLYGAIISADAETYDCMLRNYLKQLRWVNSIERDRLRAFKDESANSNSECYEAYQEFPYKDIDETVGAALTSGFSLADAQKLSEAAASIEYMNDDLIRGRGGKTCAWLY